MRCVGKSENKIALAVLLNLVNVYDFRPKRGKCSCAFDVFRYVEWFQLGAGLD